jgi:N utilization substance protein A
MVELTEKGLKYFNEFERITRVMPSDYLESENGIIFLVGLVQLGRAIGKKGANVAKLKERFRKKVVVIGDSNDPELFVRNFFNNVEIVNIEIANVMGEQNIVLTVDEKDRGIAIGKAGERIKAAKEFLKKKFNATIVLRTKRSDISPGVASRGVEIDERGSLADAVESKEKKEEKSNN